MQILNAPSAKNLPNDAKQIISGILGLSYQLQIVLPHFCMHAWTDATSKVGSRTTRRLKNTEQVPTVMDFQQSPDLNAMEHFKSGIRRLKKSIVLCEKKMLWEKLLNHAGTP